MRVSLLLTFLFASLTLVAQAPKKDWAKYEKYAAANDVILQAIAADPDAAPKAVFMGNSITELWAKHRASFFADNGYVPRGISGQTTYQMLARFQRDVVDLHPEAVVILAGINDIAENSGPISLENIVGNIKSMCDIAGKIIDQASLALRAEEIKVEYGLKEKEKPLIGYLGNS